MMRKLLYILVVFMLTSACSTPKALKSFSGNRLIFGSGGGFTNRGTTYTLSYDGSLYKVNELTGQRDKITVIPKKEAKKIFIKFLKAGLDTMEYSKPGNIYRFIGFENDSATRKIVWGNPDEAPRKAKEMYDILVQLVKRSNNK